MTKINIVLPYTFVFSNSKWNTLVKNLNDAPKGYINLIRICKLKLHRYADDTPKYSRSNKKLVSKNFLCSISSRLETVLHSAIIVTLTIAFEMRNMKVSIPMSKFDCSQLVDKFVSLFACIFPALCWFSTILALNASFPIVIDQLEKLHLITASSQRSVSKWMKGTPCRICKNGSRCRNMQKLVWFWQFLLQNPCWIINPAAATHHGLYFCSCCSFCSF